MYIRLIGLVLLCCSSFLACNTQSTTVASADETPLSNTLKTSIVQELRAHDHLPVEEQIALYHQLKKDSAHLYYFDNEDELNMYGYSFLWSDRTKDAIAIFKLLVSEFPDSANPYDSLAEAYLADGNQALSLANYQKSLALNPHNFNAEDQIDRIQFPDKKRETTAEKFSKIYTVEQYKADLDQLAQRLIEVHPAVFKFISQEDFWQVVEQKKALITPFTTFAEFTWHCNEVVANVNCSHTGLSGFWNEWQMLPVALRFPVQVHYLNDQLFVVDAYNNEDRLAVKDQILSINGIAVAELMSNIYKHIPSQGYVQSMKRHRFNEWAVMMIPYALNFPEKYEVKLKGKAQTLVLNTADKQANDFQPLFKKPCPDNLCFEILEDQKTALLTVSSFNYYAWNNLSDFTDFVDQAFQDIQAAAVEHLIVDVRFNGGGSPESSIHLLKYLSNQAFTYSANSTYQAGALQQLQAPFENAFKGKSYFLIDGNGNSTTGHFMSLVKTLQLGTIIGEELGSNQFCTAGQTVARLKNSKLTYYIANSEHRTTAKTLPDEQGILPDHYVNLSIDDYLNNVDAVKNYALKLIEDQ